MPTKLRQKAECNCTEDGCSQHPGSFDAVSPAINTLHGAAQPAADQSHSIQNPPDSLTLDFLHTVVRQLHDVSPRLPQDLRDLLTRPVPGVDVLQQEASGAIKALTRAIEQAQRAWESAIEKEMERRTSEAAKYSTGKCTDVAFFSPS